jgi:phospholipase C
MSYAISLLLLLVSVSSMFAQTLPFQHIVIVTQENRTPDNLFGSNPTFEPGVDISLTTVSKKGIPATATPYPLAGCYDNGHGHQVWVAQFDGGKMDGFSTPPFRSATCVSPPHPQVVYVDNSTGTVQPYFDIATSYGFANRMFQTNQGPSFPAHQFLLSGTSSPTETSDLFAMNNPGGGAGSVAPLTAKILMIDPSGATSTQYPCFERPTLTDSLDAAGLTWRYYTVALNTALWSAPNAIQHMCYPVVNSKCAGPAYANVVTNPTHALTDIQNCKLSNVVWVNPTGYSSDHPIGNRGGGPSWVASIVNAIGQSSCGYWQNTAILITWDDWGGFFDHVAPPSQGQPNGWGVSYVYGFRVPLLVVSAYTPAGYVDNDTHDFGSILKFAEHNFNLGLIGPGFYADAYADDLSAFFTLTTPRPFSAIAAPIKAQAFIQSKEPQTAPDNDEDEE